VSRNRSKSHPAAGQPRPSRRIHEEAPPKLSGNAVCPRCGASYQKGRWTWKQAETGSIEHVCPACERVATEYPAGVLHVGGEFVAPNRDELIGLLRNIEERERSAHPLKRIMAVADEGAGFAITVTDAKLVETFGRALTKAYAGRLEQAPTTRGEGNLVRLHWTRD